MVESIRIPSVAESPMDLALEVSLANGQSVELTIVAPDGTDTWVVVPLSDLVGALQLLRSSAESGRPANGENG